MILTHKRIYFMHNQRFIHYFMHLIIASAHIYRPEGQRLFYIRPGAAFMPAFPLRRRANLFIRPPSQLML